MMAISGNLASGRWGQFDLVGTNIITFDYIIRYVLASIGVRTPGNPKSIYHGQSKYTSQPIDSCQIHVSGHQYRY